MVAVAKVSFNNSLTLVLKSLTAKNVILKTDFEGGKNYHFLKFFRATFSLKKQTIQFLFCICNVNFSLVDEKLCLNL